MRRRILKTLNEVELAKIPERHRPDGPVERNVVLYVDLPPLNKVTNRVEVIFDGAEPEVKEDELVLSDKE
jgi:hypothetical protein